MSFEVGIARLTVELARSAYRSAERAESDAAALGLTDFAWYTADSTQAFSASDADCGYLAFRGTEANPVDWTQNARFKPIVGELGGKVHSGFRSGVDEVWDGVLADVATLGKLMVLTGHSLGGALATLAASRLHEAGHPIAAVYTYGQPRTGLTDFRSAFEARLDDVTYRFTNHIGSGDPCTAALPGIPAYRAAGLLRRSGEGPRQCGRLEDRVRRPEVSACAFRADRGCRVGATRAAHIRRARGRYAGLSVVNISPGHAAPRMCTIAVKGKRRCGYAPATEAATAAYKQVARRLGPGGSAWKTSSIRRSPARSSSSCRRSANGSVGRTSCDRCFSHDDDRLASPGVALSC